MCLKCRVTEMMMKMALDGSQVSFMLQATATFKSSRQKNQVIKPLKVVFYGSSHLNYTGELFPTEIRGNALSIRALFGSIATILTPLVLNMKQYWVSNFLSLCHIKSYQNDKIIKKQWLPNVAMGTLCFMTAFAYIKMPETHNRPLAQTIEEAEELMKTKSDI